MAGRVTFGPSIQAVPGRPAVCDLVVENTATVPDVFSFDVDGQASLWTTVSPSRLEVGPGEREVARVTCIVPRGQDPPAGAMVLRVGVSSRAERSRPVVAEVVLHIAAFADVSAELRPETSSGWRSGEHTVTLRNRGNAQVVATVQVQHADDDLIIAVEPATMVVPAGSSAACLVTATCGSRLTRGPEQRHRFSLRVAGQGVSPVVLEGGMLQQPRRWLQRAPGG